VSLEEGDAMLRSERNVAVLIVLAAFALVSVPGSVVAAERIAAWQRVTADRAGVSFEVPADWSVQRKRAPAGLSANELAALSPRTSDDVSPAAVLVFVAPNLAGLVTNTSDAEELADGKVVNSRVRRIGKLRVFQVDSREVATDTNVGRAEFVHRILVFDHDSDQVGIRILADRSRYESAAELRSHVVESLEPR
jgi:hypothetical protein